MLLYFFGQLNDALPPAVGLKSRVRLGAQVVLLFIASYFAWVYLAGRFQLG
ncbi:hypothetical protein V6C53_07645 [Desulfocurvibacter africanus]|uniref:hypothetical protein n=1 Tax=Desulfocurvibacter africanus TaxID=873 RepID=UPI002FDB8A10